MKKTPYFPSHPAKPVLSWGKSWSRLFHLFKNPGTLRAVPLSEEDRVVVGAARLVRPLPRLKGNVYHTMKEILRLFLKRWGDAPRAVNLSLRTTYTSLAKLCCNHDPKTAYLHVLALIEHGFLRAKQRLSHGVQLLLNPDLLVFEGPAPSPPLQSLVSAQRAPNPAPEPGGPLAGAELTAWIMQFAENLRDKFSVSTA